MSNLSLVRLGDVCQTTSGGTPSRVRTDFYGGDIPWIKSGDLTGGSVNASGECITELGLKNSSAKLFKPGTLLIAMYGATVGKLGILEVEAATNQAICGITPGAGIDTLYLFYFLMHRQKYLVGQSIGGAQPNISQKIIRELRIPVPSMSDQHRIVNILKCADSIRHLRKQAQDTVRQLIPALFIDIFGDPATNPNGWPIREVSDFIQRFEGGKNLKAGTDTPRNYRILKVSAVTSGIYKENESKPAPDEYAPPQKHCVREGDLLFSRANTEALVGATALVEKTNDKTLLPDKLWRFVLAEEIEPIYVYALFQSRYVRQELSKLSTGTSASMRNISQAKLKTLKLPVPPYEKQKQFAARVRQVQAIQMQQSIALETATDTFNSVLSRAFSGHL